MIFIGLMIISFKDNSAEIFRTYRLYRKEWHKTLRSIPTREINKALEYITNKALIAKLERVKFWRSMSIYLFAFMVIGAFFKPFWYVPAFLYEIKDFIYSAMH